MQRARIPRPAVALLALAACQSYRPQPLEPEEILKRLETRRAEAPAGTLSWGECVALLLERNPRVIEARAALATAQAKAGAGTPLANPSLDLALFGGERKGVESAVGWALSLAGGRRLATERNQLAAEAAALEAAHVEREEYLAMRREFAEVALAGRRVGAHEALLAAGQALVDYTRRLVKAAAASALDQREVELEALRTEAALLAAREDEEGARGRLAARLGIDAARVGTCDLPLAPSEIPAPEGLRALLLREHTGLAARRARYDLAEMELRLEIARQYPLLTVGPAWQREEGVDRLGLALGIEIPLFDRNQGPIAEARARREEVRAGYEAEAERALGAVDAARRRIEARTSRAAFVAQRLQLAAEGALAEARRALDAGAIDPARFLAVVRAEREARLSAEEAQGALLHAWLDLADACGAPVVVFPGEVPAS